MCKSWDELFIFYSVIINDFPCQSYLYRLVTPTTLFFCPPAKDFKQLCQISITRVFEMTRDSLLPVAHQLSLLSHRFTQAFIEMFPPQQPITAFLDVTH